MFALPKHIAYEMPIKSNYIQQKTFILGSKTTKYDLLTLNKSSLAAAPL